MTTRPSAFQIALLITCGSLLAGFSCFYTADNTSSGLGVLGFVLGVAALAGAAVFLIARRGKAPSGLPLPIHSDAPSPPPQPGPTVGQGITLGICGFLLFFFSCGGAILPVRGSSAGPLTLVGVPGMIAGGVFMVWGVVWFAIGIGRAFRRPKN